MNTNNDRPAILSVPACQPRKRLPSNPTLRWFHLIAVVCLCSLSAAAPSRADTIDTLSSFSGQSVDTFGDLAGNNPGGTTFGQTFTVGGNAELAQDISFLVRPYYPYVASAPCTFQVFLMSWNGSRPVGPVLFASSPQTTSGSFFSFQQFDVSLANTHLAQGRQYVAFFTADNYLNGIRADAAMGANSNPNPGGNFVTHQGESSFNDLLTSDWGAPFGSSFNLAFKLDLQPVPEPSAAVLFGLAGAAALAKRRFHPHSRE